MKGAKLLCLLALLMPASMALAQTGKIAGVVTDASTGEALPGVNIVIEGTTQGATTDLEGFYNILNVRPGTYSLRASFIGYTAIVRENVRVNIDLTTEQDFALSEETVGLDEVTVMAERPIVQRDISANVANFNAEEIENMPVAGVTEVIDLQAGIEPGLRIRGGNINEIGFFIDGMQAPTGRTRQPFTNVSFTSIAEVQVMTGGFNAEYGEARSGIINIVTKEPRDQYTADFMVRYSSPSQKYFGTSPDDPMSYAHRPYLDMTDSLAYYGTDSWDLWTRQNYPAFQNGWKQQLEDNLKNEDPLDDALTLDDLMAIYQWRTRASAEVTNPDFDVDGSFGGPVPGISKSLGNLRFLASFRQNQEAYAIPAEREVYTGRTGQLKLISDIRPGMKLVLNGLMSTELGMNGSGEGYPTMLRGTMPVYPWQNDDWYFANQMSENDYLFLGNRAIMDIKQNMFGGEFTHTVSPNTFYEVRLQRHYTDYFSRPSDTLAKDVIVAYAYNGEIIDDQNHPDWGKGYPLNAAPRGFDPEHGQSSPIGSRYLGGGTLARDTSTVQVWAGAFDITSQLNRYMQVKAGLEYQYQDYDVNHGVDDPYHPHHENPKFVYHRQPTKGAAYAQTKLEFRGMVANLGLRLDYFHAAGDWYEYTPFDFTLASYGKEVLDEELETAPTKRLITPSPRLGVSFPITENSKFFFNYGHFRQTLEVRDLYVVRESFGGKIRALGNPNHPMEKTVQYELGYEQNLFNQVLLRLGGYYKDISNKSLGVRFLNLDSQVDYNTPFPLQYEDTRGLEITLQKNRGKWIRGFVNYTYHVRKYGAYGYPFQYENQVEQTRSEERWRNFQTRPIPEPFARFNIEFLVPDNFGPIVADARPLGDWRISFLGDWRSGQRFTYLGGGSVSNDVGIRDNMKLRDYYNLDMRLSKNFDTSLGQAQFFVDITNVLNIRRLNYYRGWGENFNQERYMASLHLDPDAFIGRDGKVPETVQNIPGNDRPGDYRSPDVEFQPIVYVADVTTYDTNSAHERPLYYNAANGQYFQWNGSQFVPADQAKVNQVLDDKAYIDMPAVSWMNFFNPRDVYFGLRVTL